MIGITEKNATEEVKKVLNKLGVPIDNDSLKIKIIPSLKVNKPVLISFNDKETRNLVLEKRKELGSINNTMCGIEGVEKKIYVNEDIPKQIRNLFTKAKNLKNNGYKFVWMKNQQVFCTKEEKSKISRIRDLEHLEEISKLPEEAQNQPALT